jgi:hypothetical protein
MSQDDACAQNDREEVVTADPAYRTWIAFNMQHYFGYSNVSSANCVAFASSLTPGGRNEVFSEAMIEAFLTYVASAYPQGVRLCKSLDLLSDCILSGRPSSSHILDARIMEAINSYTQVEEKERSDFSGDLQEVLLCPKFISASF